MFNTGVSDDPVLFCSVHSARSGGIIRTTFQFSLI